MDLTDNHHFHSGFSITFIIVGLNKLACQNAISKVQNIKRSIDKVILAIGNNPSEQRNKASLVATTDYILFLDNDSELDKNTLDYYIKTIASFNSPDVIGGPAIYKSMSLIQECFQCIYSSYFGFAFSKARYLPTGKARKSSEKELILCNLCIKTSFFIRNSGFDTSLYPNEENEFLNRVQKNSKIIYQPLASVQRDAVKNISEFIFKLFEYGSGRCKQFSKRPSQFSFLYTIPSLFVVYLILLIILPKTFILLFPLIVYSALALFFATLNCINKSHCSIPIVFSLYFLTHVAYGLGFLKQLMLGSDNKKTITEIQIIELIES